MEIARLNALVHQAVDAAVKDSEEGVREAMTPIFEECHSGEALAWVLGMIGIATKGMERGGDAIAVPRVGRMNEDGTMGLAVNIDEAPHGVAAYSRLAAAWLNDDRDAAVAVWGALVADETDPDGDELARCMFIALHAAAGRVKHDRARLQ